MIGASHLLALSLISGAAVTTQVDSTKGTKGRTIRGYLAANPLAAFNGITSGTLTYALPFFTGGEYGVAVSGGVSIHSHNVFELRFSNGRPNAITSHTQYHAGYLFFLLDYLGMTDKGLYAGVFTKLTDNKIRPNDVHYFSLIPYLAIGYWFRYNRLFCDLRLQQTVLAVAFSNAPHTGTGVEPLFSPIPGVVPVLPSLLLNVGVEF